MGLFDKLFSGKEEEEKKTGSGKKAPRLFTSPQQAQKAGAAPSQPSAAPGAAQKSSASRRQAAKKTPSGKQAPATPADKPGPSGKTKPPALAKSAAKPPAGAARKPDADSPAGDVASGDTVNLPRERRTTPPQSPPVKPSSGMEEPPHARRVSSRRSWRKRTSTKSRQLGQLLLKHESIQQRHLDEALDEQQRNGGLLGQILVRLGHCEKADIGRALARQRTITTIDLDDVAFEKEALAMLPRELCAEQRVLPFEKMGNLLCVAMTNVLDATTKTRIRETAKMQVKTFDAAWDQILEHIEKEYPAAAPAETTPAEGSPAGAVPSPETTAAATTSEPADAEDYIIELPEEEELASGGNGAKTDEADDSRTQN